MPLTNSVNSNRQLQGTSSYLAPHQGAKLYAEVQFQDNWGPCGMCPCKRCPGGACCIPACCESSRVSQRHYARVYENRLEYNIPCCTYTFVWFVFYSFCAVLTYLFSPCSYSCVNCFVHSPLLMLEQGTMFRRQRCRGLL